MAATNPHEDKPSGLDHLAKDPYLCDVCGRGFPSKQDYETHRPQH